MQLEDRALIAMKNTTGPAKVAMRLIYLYFAIIFAMYGLFFGLGIYYQFNPDFYFNFMSNADDIERGFTIASRLAYIACGIFFAIWTYRTHANFKVFGHRTYQNQSSAMAGWAYFIPFINFYLPYQIVTENWENFQMIIAKTTGNMGKDNALILPWWIFFILAILIDSLGRMMLNEIGNDMTALAFAGVVIFIRLIAGIFAVLMIKSFIKMEQQVVELVFGQQENLTAYDSLISE